MKMKNPRSSELVFSGFCQIEVTADDFRKTVKNEGVAKGSEKKKNTTHSKSMTKRIGQILNSRKKKCPTNANEHNDNDRNSLSGFSNNGQQSVANKSIDSGTTINASNLHFEKIYSAKTTTPTCEISSLSKTAVVVGKREDNELIINDKNNENERRVRSQRTWKSLRRLVNKGRNSKQQSQSVASLEYSDTNARKPFHRRHAKSHDGAVSLGVIPSSSFLNTSYPMRKRFYSEGIGTEEQKRQHYRANTSFSGGIHYGSKSRHAFDQVIRGRLDGIDLLSLGPVCRTSLPDKSLDIMSKVETKKSNPPAQCNISDGDDSENESFDPLHYSFTTLQRTVSPGKLVDEMIWSSAVVDQPEVILEGFYPGGNDRWSVRIPSSSSLEEQLVSKSSEAAENSNQSLSPLSAFITKKASSSDDDSTAVSSWHTHKTDFDGSTNIPIDELWNSLWGLVATPPPIPSHMNTQMVTMVAKAADCNEEEYHMVNEEEEIQKIVETCNVPVDLDDDAFIIDCPQHLQSIHELLMVPLQSRCFDSVVSIFKKVLRGLQGNKKLKHLNGSTNHNIGMIHLCRGNYKDAMQSFQKAVDIRKGCLPSYHPDIVVSLQRKGMAQFGLGLVGDALVSFESSLAIYTPVDNTRAKILNNIGVARYQLEDYGQALKSFTAALEIQRPWIEGPIRRESVVYSASTILSNIGKVYLEKGDHDLAYFVFEEAYLMQTSTFSKDHSIALSSLDNMARSLAKNGNYVEALRIFTSLYRSQESKFGPDSEICIETVGIMGIAHYKLLEYEEAEKCMKRVDTWHIKHGIDQYHPSALIKDKQFKLIKEGLQGNEPMWV